MSQAPRVWRPGDRVEMRKLRYDGTVLAHWQEVVWHADGDYMIFYETPGLPMHLANGDVWMTQNFGLLHFWRNAPYFILELYYPENHAHRSWYCNIQMPVRETADGFEWIDLDLDLWVYPDLTYEVLDEDEYAERRELYGYSAEARQIAESTLPQLIAWVERVEYPFRRDVANVDEEMARLAAKFQIVAPGAA